MKKPIVTLLLLIALMVPALARASEPRDFAEFASKPGFEYTYIAPEMLRMMGSRPFNNKAMGDVFIDAKEIETIEVVSTPTQSQDESLWTTIRKVKENNKLKTLATKQSATRRNDILGVVSPDGKTIKKLMIVTQWGAKGVSAVFLTGNISLGSLSNAMNAMY